MSQSIIEALDALQESIAQASTETRKLQKAVGDIPAGVEHSVLKQLKFVETATASAVKEISSQFTADVRADVEAISQSNTRKFEEAHATLLQTTIEIREAAALSASKRQPVIGILIAAAIVIVLALGGGLGAYWTGLATGTANTEATLTRDAGRLGRLDVKTAETLIALLDMHNITQLRQITPGDVSWMLSDRGRTMKTLSAIAAHTDGQDGAPWPCIGFDHQGWTRGDEKLKTCTIIRE